MGEGLMPSSAVLIDRDGVLVTFCDVDGIAASIELIDAEDGEYVAVDDGGQVLKVGTRPDPRSGPPLVVVVPTGRTVDPWVVQDAIASALTQGERTNGRAADLRGTIELVHRRGRRGLVCVDAERTAALRALLDSQGSGEGTG